MVIPEIDSRHPKVSEAGVVEKLAPYLERLDILLVHNALTLHFNLPLRAALWRLAERARPRLVSWCHDLSWANPLYRPIMKPYARWTLLRQHHPRITTVCVSEQRRREWLDLSHAPGGSAQVIPNGIDLTALLALQPTTRLLVKRFALDRVDVVLEPSADHRA